MGIGRHGCNKPKTDATYSAQWSGVSYAPHCAGNCPDCGARLHHESNCHYCPQCDDFKRRPDNCDRK